VVSEVTVVSIVWVVYAVEAPVPVPMGPLPIGPVPMGPNPLTGDPVLMGYGPWVGLVAGEPLPTGAEPLGDPVPDNGLLLDVGETPVPDTGLLLDVGETPVPDNGLLLDVGETPVLMGPTGVGAVPLEAEEVTGIGDTTTVEVKLLPLLYPY